MSPVIDFYHEGAMHRMGVEISFTIILHFFQIYEDCSLLGMQIIPVHTVLPADDTLPHTFRLLS